MIEPLYITIAGTLQAIENCRKYNNPDWEQRHRDRLEWLAQNCLPHGSGFDCGTSIDLSKSTPEKIILSFEFHHMNENGFYTHWTSHVVKVTASLVHRINLRISGRNKNGVIDDFHGIMHSALTAEFDTDRLRDI